MIKRFLIVTCTAMPGTLAMAQDPADTPLSVSGSVDAYYKYDFSGFRTAAGYSNISTSFANEQNSVSLGMLDVVLEKSVGKVSFVGDISFGPRGQFQSLPNGSADPANISNSFNIQNLYATYQFSDRFSLTAGYMGTFVGYEVITPTANFNYSTSYLFTNGPFQNAGIKGTFTFSDKIRLMAGLFNDWNTYQDFNGVSHLGVQVSVSPFDNWIAYVNVLTGKGASGPANYGSGTVIDLTTSYQFTDDFRVGLNAADYSLPNHNDGYSGIAVYPQIALSDSFTLGVRGEYFDVKNGGAPFTSLTLSGNIKSGPLTIIPEVRVDNNQSSPFFKKDLAPAKTASQFLIAAVYAF